MYLQGKVLNALPFPYINQMLHQKTETENLEAFKIHAVVHRIDGEVKENPMYRLGKNKYSWFVELFVVADYAHRDRNGRITYLNLVTPILESRHTQKPHIELSFATPRSEFILRCKNMQPKTSPNIDSPIVCMHGGKGEVLHDVKIPLFIQAWVPGQEEAIRPDQLEYPAKALHLPISS